LIEETRTNLVLQSSAFNTTWSLDEILAFGSGSIVDATTSPDGTVNADLIVPNTNSSSVHRVRLAVVTTAAANTASFYAKAAGYSKIGFRDGQTTGAYATFNLSTGQVISQGSGGTGSIENAGNGWYRCFVTLTAGAVTRLDITPLPDTYISGSPLFTYSGDGTSGVYLWGAQLELGTFASSYIPTTTTSLTRNADSVTMTGTNFSDWYTSGSGTIIVSTLLSALSTTAAQTSINLGVDGNNQIYLYANNTAGSRDAVIVTSGSGQGFNSISGANTTSYTKQGFAFATNSSAHVINGGSPVTDATVTLPSAANTLTIGSNLSGFNLLNGYVAKIMYWPQRLTNAELQAFTK
jgi:hypothetical protein